MTKRTMHSAPLVDLTVSLPLAGTVTPLHFDWHDNILVQLSGRKLILLYPPECTEALYPMAGVRNASQVHAEAPNSDITSWQQVHAEAPDLEAFPKAADAVPKQQVHHSSCSIGTNCDAFCDAFCGAFCDACCLSWCLSWSLSWCDTM